MSMKYPYRDLGVPFDRNFRNDLNANFDDIEHDIRMIGGEAAQQALEAAEEANTQAIYAQTSGDYANDKGDYAAQQGDYAQTQGNFANEKGLYAQQQGDYAKAQGDYAKQVGDENKTRWLTAVNTYADIATTYPNPQLGDTVQTIDDSKIYRWDGTQWVWTQQYNANAITDVQNKIGILNKKGEGFVNVKEYGAKGDYNKATGIGSDDTTALNQVLSDKRGNEIYFPKGTYLISSSLIVYNDTTIRLHPQAEIYLKANSANAAYANSYNGTHLLKNHPTEGVQNIKVIGGIWNGNGANQPHDSMRGLRFEGVTNLSIENVKISEVNGWGIVILKCQKFLCRNIEFDQMEGQAENGDGIHVSSSSDGLIENVHGFTNDDMVALFAGDPLFSYKSDVKDIIIRNIRTKKKGSYDAYKAVALYAANSYKVDNVVIDGITGNTYAPIVIIANPYASSGAGYFGKIAISNVIGNTVSERQPFNIDKYGDSGGDTSKKVFIDSLIISNYQRQKDSAHLNSQPIILAQYADIKNLMITNFNDEYDGAGGQLFKSNYANIDNLTLNGYNRKQVTSGLDSDSVFYMTNTTISSFIISNITDIVLSNGSPVVEVDINCIIKNLKANNIRRNFTTGNTTPFTTFLFVHATSEVTDIEVDNINIVSEDNNIPPLIYQYGKIDRAFLSNIKNYSKTLPNPVPLYTKNRTADSQVTLIKFSNVYTGTYYAGYANFSVVAGNVRAVGVDVIADTSKITDPKKGDVVTTKDGNLVIYNGTTWTTIG